METYFEVLTDHLKPDIFGDFSKGKEEGSVEELGNTTLIPSSIIISIKEIKLNKEVTMAKKKVKKKKIKKKKKKKAKKKR